MTDYTTITENFGDTICQEFLEKTKEKFKRVPLVPREHESVYWLGVTRDEFGREIPINLMEGLMKKINSYFNTVNDNEFIVGFIIDTETICGSGSPNHRTNLNYCSYLITNYGNIYIFDYCSKLDEKRLSTGKYIEIPDKIGRYSNYQRVYDLYIRLEKILIVNQKLFDSEIDEIKKDVLIKNKTTICCQWSNPNYDISVDYLYEPSKNIHFNSLNPDISNINFIKDLSLENWKQVVLNHKKIEALRNIILDNELELQNQRDTIEGMAPGAGPLNPQQQMSIIKENAELKKHISKKKPTEPPEHFICPISSDIIREPVICMDGHTYEKSAIELWFQNHNSSPMTRAIVEPLLIPNYNLKSQIDEWYNSN